MKQELTPSTELQDIDDVKTALSHLDLSIQYIDSIVNNLLTSSADISSARATSTSMNAEFQECTIP